MKYIFYVLLSGFLSVTFAGCSNCSNKPPYNPYYEYDPDLDEDLLIRIPYTDEGNNIITVPVTINGMGVKMIYDTGASMTTISLQEALYLAKHGELDENDVQGVMNFKLADGSEYQNLIITLRELTIGNKITLYDTQASVVLNQEAPLLLGGSVFKEFREISVDRKEKVLKFYKN